MDMNTKVAVLFENRLVGVKTASTAANNLTVGYNPFEESVIQHFMWGIKDIQICKKTVTVVDSISVSVNFNAIVEKRILYLCT